MKILTQNNKKQMICPYCKQTISWNTPEQKTVMGNRTISCSNCGHNFIVPRTELQPFFERYPITYTKNIYNDGGSSDGETAKVTFINSADGYYYTVTINENGYNVVDFVEVVIPLSNGIAKIFPNQFENITNVEPTFTGDITFEDGYIEITGDGSITAAGTQEQQQPF